MGLSSYMVTFTTELFSFFPLSTTYHIWGIFNTANMEITFPINHLKVPIADIICGDKTTREFRVQCTSLKLPCDFHAI